MDALIATNSVPLAQADTAPLTGTPQYATDGNPATNTPATIWPAYQFNAIQAELLGIIGAAGIAPDRTKTNQIVVALQHLFQGGAATYAADTGTAGVYAIALEPAPLSITPGMLVGIGGIVAANPGASTLDVNWLGALPIHGPGGTALQGGEFVAGGNAILRANATAEAWELVWTNGATPVAAASQSKHAVNLGQVLTASPIGISNSGIASSISATTALFTAPSAGFLIALISLAWSSPPTSPNFSISTSLSGASILSSNLGGIFDQQILLLSMAKSDATTITATMTQTSSVSQSVSIAAIFIPNP